jgi:hypothetical protein
MAPALLYSASRRPTTCGATVANSEATLACEQAAASDGKALARELTVTTSLEMTAYPF